MVEQFILQRGHLLQKPCWPLHANLPYVIQTQTIWIFVIHNKVVFRGLCSRCFHLHTEPPCTLEEDPSLKYPYCCPKPVCPPTEDEEFDDISSDLDIAVYDLTLPEQTKQVS